MKVAIIACVEITTTTIGGTTSQTTSTSSSAVTSTSSSTVTSTSSPQTTSPSSGTTTFPTSVQTTTLCHKQMADVNSAFISSVTYLTSPVSQTNNSDLTNPNTNGISFPSTSTTTGLFDNNNQPLYQININFHPEGVNSISNMILGNPESNVNQYNVQFFAASNPNQLVLIAPNTPLSYNSTLDNNQPSISEFPPNVPSPLSGIRINILSTDNNQ